MRLAAVLVLGLLAACSRGSDGGAAATARAIIDAAGDPNGTYTIHEPVGGCPRGWKLVPWTFQEKDGSHEDGCVRPGRGGDFEVDVLRPGESTHL